MSLSVLFLFCSSGIDLMRALTDVSYRFNLDFSAGHAFGLGRVLLVPFTTALVRIMLH